MSGNTEKITIKVTKELKRDIRIAAAIEDVSMEEVARAMFTDALKRGEKHIAMAMKKYKQQLAE